ncbi:MAG TPA: farnesyl diphosphate synthase [Gemmatimonadaceae bacterium]|jgi:geranylgeranyl pyrophosphate synthase|nr:farnesyl diphosphate synthase [Gemmatimonadaceae bacterium]
MALSTSSTANSAASSRIWQSDRAAIEAALERICDEAHAIAGETVGAAIRYSVLGGGKRLRGLLFLAAHRTAGGLADASALAAAIELVHAYSLIHDDLPCMDDDDMRRGRATLHRVYGVQIATAAGVAMVPIAARSAFAAAGTLGLDAAGSAAVVAELMRASGAGGMIAGQLLDLEGEGRALGLAELERIHRAKTGALIRSSVLLGGMAAGAAKGHLEALGAFGDAIGLAFQIADDVLDVTATTDRLGKTAGRDLALQKGTYPALLGIEGATARAAALVDEGCAALRGAGLLSTELDTLARFVVERES